MTDLVDQDDAALVRLAQAGEMSAFEELARRFQSPLMRFARQRLGRSDAEDVVQDTLVSAYEHLGQFRSSASFSGWLFGIARHRIIDQHRQTRSQTTGADPGSTSSDNPADAADRADRRSVLWSAARAALSEPQYSALWLFYAEQMSTGEIAKVMNRSWVSVKVMLHRARTTLAGRLNESSFTDADPAARPAEVREL